MNNKIRKTKVMKRNDEDWYPSNKKPKATKRPFPVRKSKSRRVKTKMKKIVIHQVLNPQQPRELILPGNQGRQKLAPTKLKRVKTEGSTVINAQRTISIKVTCNTTSKQNMKDYLSTVIFATNLMELYGHCAIMFQKNIVLISRLDVIYVTEFVLHKLH